MIKNIEQMSEVGGAHGILKTWQLGQNWKKKKEIM